MEAVRSGERRVGAGEHIFFQGSSCTSMFTVKSGWVALYTMLPNGQRQIDEFCVAGALIGMRSQSAEAPMAVGALALTDTMLCVLPAAAIERLFDRLPSLAVGYARLAAAAQERAFVRLADLGRRDARTRTARLLLELHRMATNAGSQPTIPLTQQELADALGLTPVHISRVLRAWREHGILTVAQGRFRVLDAVRLAAEAAEGA